MPGLIEGAHLGRGLGIEFLRHIERTRILLFLIDCTGEEPRTQYETLVHELGSFNKDLLDKPRLIALSKVDLADADARKPLLKGLPKRGIPVVCLSSVTGEGVKELLDAVWKKLKTLTV